MSTRSLVDPELLPLLDMLPESEFSVESLPAIREGFMADMLPSTVDGLAPQMVIADGVNGAPDVPLVLFNPPSTNRKRAAILHLHGGGMVIGNAMMSTATFAILMPELDIVAVSVDYRLAPEARFPEPQEDCYTGLAWLVAHAEELGVDPTRIAVMGESAGGGLAAALAQMVRDRGEYSLAAQILIYPMLDHRTGSIADESKASSTQDACPYANPTTGEFIWTRASNRFGWSSLRGDYAADDNRRGWFSPTLAESLAGLPPTFINVGGLDLFLDEDMDYALRLSAAGVPCELHVYPGAFHAFNLVAESGVAQQANDDLLRAIRRLLSIGEAV